MAKDKQDKSLLVKDNEGTVFKKEAFMVEDEHPVVGRILIVDGKKYKIMDDFPNKHEGTFIKLMSEEDEERIAEYDNDVDELSEKLMEKIDIKRLIKEQIKKKAHASIKTGLFILKEEEKGKDVVTTHRGGCYDFTMECGDLIFGFISDAQPEIREMNIN